MDTPATRVKLAPPPKLVALWPATAQVIDQNSMGTGGQYRIDLYSLHISDASQVDGSRFLLLQSCELKLYNSKENAQLLVVTHNATE